MNQHAESPGYGMDFERLREFELHLDPKHPERSAIPARIIGFGEISTVLEIDLGAGSPLACKRMPMFRTDEEVRNFAKLYREYVTILEEVIGLRIAPGEFLWIIDAGREAVTAYIVQEKLPAEMIGNRIIHRLSKEEVIRMVQAVVREISRVFDFNLQHKGELEVAIDGQISNWAVAGTETGSLEEIRLVYFDTSSPFVRRNGRERLDPELFLRSAPSFLVWILRIFFLEDVMHRYYDFRKVCIDLIANFYKEQLPDLVPDLVSAVNQQLSARTDIAPLTVGEVRAYYSQDAWIWRLYLTFRKIDRMLHQILRRPYPYILPDRIRR